MPRRRGRPAAVALTTLLLSVAGAAARAQVSGELRLRMDPMSTNPRSASVQGNRLSDVVPPPLRSEGSFETTLRLKLDIVQIELGLHGFADRAGGQTSSGRFNELYGSAPAAGLQWSGGRRVVQWDVGFGFRPNDLVQQEQTRNLLTVPLQGRELLQVERFGTDSAASLVWVSPRHWNAATENQRGERESALAAMVFMRDGATDYYGFARLGRRTGPSLGAAAVGVLSDSLAVHGSARWMRRHDGWTDGDGGDGAPPVADDATLLATSPWRRRTRGPAAQLLVGANWTGEAKQSVLVEWWYDGTTLSDAEWRRWGERTGALSALATAAAAPSTGVATPLAANLAWQDLPLAVLNQRRQTVLLRLSWQPEPWLLSVDALYNPADAGRVVTAGLQWQGEGLRLNAAIRWYGGPAASLAARLPQRHSAVVAATWTF